LYSRACNTNSRQFSTALCCGFADLLLADEINRTPVKVQSALLKVMQVR
jgi:MoxR-like ATPase